MSDIRVLPTSKEKKRPSVSSKCLLNIKSIVTQNVSVNNNNRNASTSKLAPLPLALTKESIEHVEIEENKAKSIPNRDVLKDVLQIPAEKKHSMTNGHARENEESSLNISKQSDSVNSNESSIIPPLPLDFSMYPFGSSSYSSSQKKPLSSFPVRSSNRINEEYVAQMHRIIASSLENSKEIEPIELSITRQQTISMQGFDSESPTISTVDGNEDANLNSPLVFVNRSLNLPVADSPTISAQTAASKSRSSERSKREFYSNGKGIPHHQFHPNCPTNYTRLPHSLRTKNPSPILPLMSDSPLRRPSPLFETVRTPVQKSPSMIPSELFDCCQTSGSSQHRSHRLSNTPTTTMENNLSESENRSNYFREMKKIREIMHNASQRLTQDLVSSTSLPLVDTHCHFDLIFDRLRIKHNDLTKYFIDYNEYYPSGLSFELAIQVFWRPKQLTADNWLNWYSKYLDDERVYGSCGIHPHWSSEWSETSASDIERCLQHPKIVAIGEIGLDFGPKNICSEHDQRRAFENQLKLAAKWFKPIVIHSRDAYKLTFHLMKQYLQSDHKIHLHCFVGTMDDVQLFTSYFTEIKFGFTPVITRFDSLHTVIQQISLTQILSETDSPYFIPDELRLHARCAHPGMVYSVVEMVAQLRHLPIFDVACQLRENARDIYGI